jgi:two-component system alkaline phosphatase synthesis response regulator PhoP
MAKAKILIAEDDLPLLDLYDKKFTKCGFEVIRAEDGGQAVEKARTENPDLMLLDVMMPVMNGFEVLKKVKDMPEFSNTPVVILSNYGEMPNITEGLMSGAVEYLIKVEHTPEEVVEVVEDALKERESLIGKAFKETK